MMEDLDSYLETHYEIVNFIESNKYEMGSFVFNEYAGGGTGRMYELAKELTDKFQLQHKDENWHEKDYFEELDLFWEKEEKLRVKI